MTRDVNPDPDALVDLATVLAPIRRSFADVVVNAPLSLVSAEPLAPTPPSSGFAVSRPLYSATRMSE
jgi:hypothetical protein